MLLALGRPRPSRAVYLVSRRREARGIAQNFFGRYGPKYTAKIEKADAEWAEKAKRIRSGEEQSMWKFLEERGFIKDVAGNAASIEKLMTRKRIGAYVGIDPTADSMHVGHLLPMMPLFWMYMHGFRAVSVLGSATAKVGDPTGRLTSREQMRSSELTMNLVKIHYQLKMLWQNVDEQARRYGFERDWAWRRGIMQNSHWWNKLPFIEVMRRLGAGMRLGPMLSRDTVRRKMDEGDGMSFAEFGYPLMQAWDWWHLYVKQGIQMQIGGSDQYGNIVTGCDAFRIIRDSEPDPQRQLPSGPDHDPVGFTVPLLTDSNGNKFGKSAGNAVWLDRFKTPAVELYGYFMRRPDDQVEQLLKLFTFIPTRQIDEIMAVQREQPQMRTAHHSLAYEVVALVHGMKIADETAARHKMMYQKKSRKIQPADEDDLEDIAARIQRQGGPINEGLPTNEEQEAGEDDVEVDEKGLVKSKKPYQIATRLTNAPPVDLKLPRKLFDEGKVARILYAAGLVNSISEGNRLAIKRGAYVGASPGQKPGVNKGMSLMQLDFTPVSLWFPQDTKNFIIDDRYMVLRRGQHTVRIIEIVTDAEWEKSGRTYPGEPYTGKSRMAQKRLKNLKEKMAEGLQDAEKDQTGEEKEEDAPSEEELAEREAEFEKDFDNSIVFPDREPKKEKTEKTEKPEEKGNDQ